MAQKACAFCKGLICALLTPDTGVSDEILRFTQKDTKDNAGSLIALALKLIRRTLTYRPQYWTSPGAIGIAPTSLGTRRG
jgi:hypothetical protein